ncbi:hypothetical protein CDG76_12735 [Nostoc sp. 'Peltigera membranacea cyanobiont' 210A]|nr:hypothetical protein CDG76_12735 [Nostoc sp. 'Peltigera membranacea cyanobiont' 210A]
MAILYKIILNTKSPIRKTLSFFKDFPDYPDLLNYLIALTADTLANDCVFAVPSIQVATIGDALHFLCSR